MASSQGIQKTRKALAKVDPAPKVTNPTQETNENDESVFIVESPYNFNPARIPKALHNKLIDITNTSTSSGILINPKRKRENKTFSTVACQTNILENDEEQRIFQCSICLESVVKNRPVSLICGHIYCKDCITAVFQREKKCPMCLKTFVDNKSMFDLYL